VLTTKIYILLSAASDRYDGEIDDLKACMGCVGASWVRIVSVVGWYIVVRPLCLPRKIFFDLNYLSFVIFVCLREVHAFCSDIYVRVSCCLALDCGCI
jgi:hypothetical protein